MALYKQAYIAFSINGTKAFITANHPLDETMMLSKLPAGMKIANSRDPLKAPDTVKLHWDRLLTKEGKPLRSPPVILQRFKELEALGWVVDKSKFVKKHYH